MSEDLSRRFEIDALKAELARAKVRGNVGVGLGVLALVVSLLAFALVASRGNSGPSTTISQASNSSNQRSNPTFQTVSAKAIEITDANGNIGVTLSLLGLELDEPISGLRIENQGKLQTVLDENGLFLYGKGANTYLNSDGLNVSSNGPNKSSTAIYSGDIVLNTPQNYNVVLGNLGAGPNAAGLYVFNERYDKSHSGGGPINASSATFTPTNISLDDESGITRVSIGQTPLTTPATGENETTGLSSVVLFDTSGHVSWETP